MPLRTALAAVIAFGLASPALADAPPADALPLSEIIALVEQARDVAYVDEVDWDEDDRVWEIEYVRRSGGEVEIEVDPVTGAIRDR